MKLTNLLTGAAVAALLTGTANAQIVAGNQDGNATNDLGASLVFASELDLAEAAPTGHVELALGALEIAALNALAATDSVTIKFDLSGGLSWDGNLSDANHIGAVATCEFNISAAGGTGTQTVSYALDGTTEDATTCDAAADLAFRFPIEITAPGNVSFTMSLTSTGTVLRSGAVDVDLGTAGTQAYVRTAQAFTYAFADDATTEAVSLAAGYETFVGGGILGTLTGTDTAGVIVAANNTLNTAADSSNDAQVDGGELTVTFPQPAGLASVTLGLAVPVTEDLVAGVATFDLSAAQMDEFDGASINIIANEATGADAAPIANQQPTAVFTVSSPNASDLTVSGDTAVNNTDLDALLRQGSNTTTFEWVGDTEASAANMFRAVGLGATLPTIRVTLANSTADVDGEYVLTPSNTLTNGELLITEDDIQAAVGSAFGRADVTFSFEAAGVTVRRFIFSANGTLTDMGDDNG
ncbi:hypothetical protein ACFELO_01665 [Oceanicaulis sp. LC35]|uniref:hypothetical protein n=1 Tax=Oceanicaulis sp. LC35 TaxID=3349635 RepID=UPI003F85FF52